jgi:hypothetical protein
MDVTPDGEYSPDETYYLLSDVLPEDRELREGLQEKRLVISCRMGDSNSLILCHLTESRFGETEI